MRIDEHPILTFDRGPEIEFEFDGRRLRGCEGETIAAALHAAGVRVLRESIRLGRPRGFFCAIGRCSSCLMTVDGIPNVMTCITPLEKGMRIETQTTKGALAQGAAPRGPAPSDADGVPIVATGPAAGEDLGTVPLAIIGGGPAGLSAAVAAGQLGVRSIVIDENEIAGGQLIKQTHMFFGSREHHARVRGIDIGPKLVQSLSDLPVDLKLNTTALGLYPDLTISLLENGRHHRLSAEAVVVATGASENMLAFENADLPGVYGAGAVQTLMNVYGVVPGERVLMVGAGNIGLIVSYQLLQAGVDVVGVIEGLPEIGGYHVHAAKIRRAGVPILTSHTIVRAEGDECVRGASVVEVDENWRPVEGTARTLDVDTICLAVGLTPNAELAFQAGSRQAHVSELGGRVAVHGPDLETTIPGLYIAGDASGIEEASTAMLEGRLAGLAAARRLGAAQPEVIDRLVREAESGLEALRAGPFGKHPRYGKERMFALRQQEGDDEPQA